MGLPGYGTSPEHSSEATAAEAAAAATDSTCRKLRKALELSDAAPAGHASQVTEANDSGEGQRAEVALASTSEVRSPTRPWSIVTSDEHLDPELVRSTRQLKNTSGCTKDERRLAQVWTHSFGARLQQRTNAFRKGNSHPPRRDGLNTTNQRIVLPITVKS